MIIKRLNSVILIILFSITPFIQSATDVGIAKRLSINLLPPEISSFAGNLRWIIYALLILIFLNKIQKYFTKVEHAYLMVSAFYLVQLVYAFGTQTDLFRYVGLFILSIVLPFFIYLTFSNENTFLLIKYLRIITYLLIVGSVIINIQMIFNGYRFQGFSNNPNLYGVTAIFWLSILLIPSNGSHTRILNLNNTFIVILLITIFLSGSRNALVGVFIVLIFQYRSNLKKSVFPLIVFGGLGYYLSGIENLNFIVDRYLNISNAIGDTGRNIAWEKAMNNINQTLLWGNDMNAPLRILNTGNVHNCYLRFLLSMGLIFTIFSFVFYGRYIRIILSRKYRVVPPSLIAFIVAFTIMNFGEDFFVGMGSSVIIYFFMIIGLISFYISDSLNSNNNGIVHRSI